MSSNVKQVPRLRARLAQARDDAAIGRLLRERAMAGSIRLSLEREPSYFDSLDRECLRHATVLIEDVSSGELVGMGARQVKGALYQGQPVRLGYLSQIRLAPRRRPPLRAARHAWQLADTCRRGDELPFDITSISADNRIARRLLETGIPGQPRYHPIGEYRVQAIPARRQSPASAGIEVHQANDATWQELQALYRQRVSSASLALLGDDAQRPMTRLAARRNGHLLAGLGIEDATPWRQFVVRGYNGALRWSRPLVNLTMPLHGGPRLPRAGEALRAGNIVSMAWHEGEEAAIIALLRHAAFLAKAQHLDLLLVGGMARDPLGSLVARQLRGRPYSTLIYAVTWGDTPEFIASLRSSTLHLELSAL